MPSLRSVARQRSPTVLLVAFILRCAAPAAASPPNVVVILADDLGFSDLGCYGGEIDTPHLDRLAAGGLRFTQGYDTARCWPSRAALLTGHYPQAIGRDALPGSGGGVKGVRPAWALLLPELLAAAGYRSFHSGKWHVDGDPLAQGFARSLDVGSVGQNNYFDAAGVSAEGRPLGDRVGFYATAAIGDHAVDCLAEHARERPGTPFFHYVAFTAPHFPLQAPPQLVAKYLPRYRAGWDEVRAARCRRVRELGIVTTTPAEPEPEVGPSYQPPPETLARLGPGEIDRPRPWAELTAEQREFQAAKMAVHAAMVEAMDREVGRIVAQLEAMGALDDTLVLFASDNGASAEIMIRGEGHDPAADPGSRKTFLCLGPGWSTVANAPFRRHKTWVHEGGVATPWLVHWPRGIAAKGEFRTQPVHLVDVAPTILEAVGAEATRNRDEAARPPMHGRSFLRALLEPRSPPAHESLWWCHDGHRAVRVGDWKLVAVRGLPWELYDLAGDRCETRNLADEQPDRVAALEQEWNRIADECRSRTGSAPVKRPNVVLFLADDLGWGELGCFGNRDAITPNLDRFAAAGLRLTDCHSASSCCSPSRAALLTGRHPYRTGVFTWIPAESPIHLRASEVALPKLLRAAGYQTCHVGKWHLNGMFNSPEQPQPDDHGYDWWLATQNNAAPSHAFPTNFVRNGRPLGEVNDHSAPFIAREAVAWLEEQRDATRPFFLAVWTHEPHYPIASADRYERLHAEIADPEERTYRANVTQLDAAFGTVMQALDDLGVADDTLVIFTSDNGPEGQGDAGPGRGLAGPLRGRKRSMYEGGHRVPGLVRWPGRIGPAGESDLPVVGSDFFATILAAAGVAPPAGVRLDGVNLLPAFAAGAAERAEPMYWRWGGNVAWREGDWKIVADERLARPELYDLAADRAETTDQATREPERLAAMLGRLRKHAAAIEAEGPEWWRTEPMNGRPPRKQAARP